MPFEQCNYINTILLKIIRMTDIYRELAKSESVTL